MPGRHDVLGNVTVYTRSQYFEEFQGKFATWKWNLLDFEGLMVDYLDPTKTPHDCALWCLEDMESFIPSSVRSRTLELGV